MADNYRYRGPYGPGYRRLAYIRDEGEKTLRAHVQAAIKDALEHTWSDDTDLPRAVDAVLEALQLDLGEDPAAGFAPNPLNTFPKG